MHRFWTAMAAGTRLFVVYAIASLVPVVALGAVLAQTYKQDAVERGLEHGRAQAAVIEEMVFSPALRGALLTQGLTSAETARLQTATDLAIFHGSVLGLRLRSFDGTVVFSDDGALDGGLPATHPAFARAAAGGTHVTVLDDPVHGPAIRVLQPVVASASGRSVGVLELLLPYDAVDEAVKASTVRIYGGLGVGLGVLYVVLAGISWSVTRRLQGHAAAAVRDALHDSLTGLPNRELFRRRVEEACRQASPSAVALVDLDRFKSVNDTLGHHAGDELLREVARRLTDALRTDDVVARLGGDEFGILLTGTDGPAARRRLEEVRDEVAGEMVLDGVPMSVEASFGVASCPRDGRDVESLLRCADAAMYQGKRSTSGVVLFDPERATPQGPNPLGIQREMRRAIEQDELRLHYQPKIHLMTGATTCVEALVRWQHPERGLLPPGEFLPVVERSGLIGPLTEWVLRRALADCVAWRARGVRWSVAVNVSARNLESEGFADQVARLLAESGLPPASLQLEVTETALAVDTAAAARTLTVLAERGVATSLDDFGVGYASLSHLRSLALTEVKIDRGFVAHVESSDEDREVVRSLIQLAHGLGLTVTAEGVETEEAVTWLQAAGCDNAQGFHFSRPVPWETLAGGTTVPVQAARTPEMAP